MGNQGGMGCERDFCACGLLRGQLHLWRRWEGEEGQRELQKACGSTGVP